MDQLATDGTRDADKNLYRYKFGDVELDEARFELRVGGLTVELEQKPILVLLELLRRADEVVKREELRDAVWDGRPGVEHGLSNVIVKLRRSLGSEGARIVTVPKEGYRFVGSVQRVVAGRKYFGRLKLGAGQAVPNRVDFRLERRLGESFGNEVWLALRSADGVRSVFKFSSHGASLAALKRETQFSRVLSEKLGPRTDFVPLRSWNFSTPPFYIESEYCGQNLEQWSIENGRLEDLDLDARLDLFLQVADAVAAAHSVAVIHKDLKATNIFVVSLPSSPQLRVGDFGNAMLLEPEILAALGITRTGMTLSPEHGNDGVTGTPFYLAPELLTGAPATVQSDVYALGLLLFQLTVGNLRRPIASGWQEEIKDALLVEDISLATAGDPARRLSSVTDLATRLRNRRVRESNRIAGVAAEERALVTARALERSEARRPWIIAAGAALMLGLGVGVFSFQKERSARRLAQLEGKRAESINIFLTDMLQSADPSGPGGAAQATIASAIRHADIDLRRRFGDDAATKGSIDLTLGNVYAGLGQFDKALSFHREAVSELTVALGVHHPSTLTAAYRLAATLDMLTRHDDAKVVLDDADRAAGQLAISPSRLSYVARSSRGGHFFLQMRAAPALEQFLITDRIRMNVDPGNEAWLVNVKSHIAWCEVRLNRDAEALQSLEELMKPDYSPERIGMMEWMRIHLQTGIALSNLHRYREAEPVLLDALRTAQRILGAEHYGVGLAYNYLVVLYKAEGRLDAASDAAGREYAIWGAAVGPDHQSTLAALVDMAVVHYLKAATDASFVELRDAHSKITAALGSHSPFTQYASFYFALALLDHQNIQEAIRTADALDPLDLAAADISPDWGPRVLALRARLSQAAASNQYNPGKEIHQSAYR